MLITRIINDTRFVVIYRYFLDVDQFDDTMMHSIHNPINLDSRKPCICRRRRRWIHILMYWLRSFFRLSLFCSLNLQEIDLFHGDKHLNTDMHTKSCIDKESCNCVSKKNSIVSLFDAP